MSIIKDTSFRSQMDDYQDYDVYCDMAGCEYEERFDDCFSFSDVTEGMKESGWKITKENGEWFHICPECNE